MLNKRRPIKPIPTKKNNHRTLYTCGLIFACFLFTLPVMHALGDQEISSVNPASNSNAQTVALLDGASFTPFYGQGGAYISVVENSLHVEALVDNGPVLSQEGGESGNIINTYVVQAGDTISEIAQKFNVSQNTVIWANDLRGSSIRIGQELVILPTSGVLHTVKKGDTIKSLVKTYNGVLEETLSYNGFAENDLLTVGQQITIPNGTIPQPKRVATNRKTTSTPTKSSGLTAKAWTNRTTVYQNGVFTSGLRNTRGPNYDSYYIKPINGYSRSRGLHGNNSIDWAAPKGTPIVAAAGGTVKIAKYGGWNGGYGKYVVIKHGNGTQTLYAHMSSVDVYAGQTVVAGQLVGRVGTTGNSTGNHLHFEVRGAQNPWR